MAIDELTILFDHVLEDHGGRLGSLALAALEPAQRQTRRAGEINHTRALLQGNDDWDHEDLGREDETA